MNNSFNANEVETALFARENLKDMTVENTQLITDGWYFSRIWATAMLEISSDEIPYQNVVQDTTIYNIQNAFENPEKKYIIEFTNNEGNAKKQYKANLEEAKQNSRIEILFENENGFVAKIK